MSIFKDFYWGVLLGALGIAFIAKVHTWGARSACEDLHNKPCELKWVVIDER